MLLGVCLVSSACSGDGEDPPPPEPSTWVDVGVTSGEDGLDFEALPPGGAVPLHSFGQGGTHALLAVRCSGLGDRAFVSVTIRNVANGEEVSAPAGQEPRLLLPRGDGVYDLLPLLVMTGGLVAPGDERDGLPVSVRVDASNTAGNAASVEREAVLSTETL
jgi:hypothetical protein